VTRYFFGLVFSVSLGAQNAGLGRIEFPTSGPQEAQKRFLRGVLLLHSFEYDGAREEFQAAQKIAPDFSMAYWGEAMTYNEPLWFAQDRDAARSALNRLAPSPDARSRKAPTAREKEYLRAIDILYGNGEKEARDFSYAEAMKRLSENQPDDLNAASFYALALLGTSHRGRDFRIYMRAAAILEEIFRRNSEHPGALHYLIHTYDDPIHAPLGLKAARTYARIAPAAPHAQHMPSHIFLAMGMWDDVATSNEAAWAASEARVRRKSLPLEYYDHHSLWWLMYAYLQQGRFEDARRALATVEEHVQRNPARLIRYHLVQMRAAYQIETGRSHDSPFVVDTGDLDMPAAAGSLLAKAFVAINQGQRKDAEQALDAIRNLAPSQASNSLSHTHTYPGDTQVVEIARRELEALVLLSDGNSQRALELIAEAARIEDKMAFEFGPPTPPKPARELYGEMLLQLDRPVEARREFETSLERTPKRALSLLGLARALTRSGDSQAARKAYTELAKLWHRADPELRRALDASISR
jgi:tetratricopeptide (TPR) repeat protein